ncbi:MAG: UDP-N-acetylmuramoyl-tripeptide--D-alanyl-D-alanine ligase [Eubacterium sp.]|nr:UDP-N-acetylmuramoyl-tripeptide--D-alanyl-D-alanine ligase [Eubacterium sp.]
MNITVKDVLDITGGHLIGISDDEKTELMGYRLNSMALDSREVKEGTLFVATKGENVDAHKFIPSVASITKAILTEEDEAEIKAKADVSVLPSGVAYIKVPSSLDGMQDIAAYIRSLYKKTVIGVTGSVGKTTTREMITAALSSCIPVFHTEGNRNSQMGVPLTLADMCDKESEAAVIEMGISEPGGMDKLTRMVLPDIAVCTMIGVAHIEFMKNREGIRNEKLRIAGRMNEDGILFLNADDELLWETKGHNKVKTYFYGTNPEADFRAENIRYEDGYNTYEYVHEDKRITVMMNSLGQHNVLNSLVAMAICDVLGLDLMKAAAAFENFSGLRQKVISSDKGYTVIDDTYNASPDSMKAAVNVLRDINVPGRKIAVLGSMFELGPSSDDYHREVGEYIAEVVKTNGGLDELITIGESAKFIAQGASQADGLKVSEYDDKETATEYIKSILKPGDVISIKASNGMKLSWIVDEIK